MDNERPESKSVSRFSPWIVVMYIALILYAGISLLPFATMITTSLMTQTEARNSRQFLPGALDTITDITGCIVYANDTYLEGSDEVTRRRWVVDISDEVAAEQQYLGTNYSASYIDRDVILRIPFFSNYCAAWSGGNFGKLMGNTVKIVLIGVSGTMVFSTLMAYAFARMEFAGKDVVFAIMLSTLMIPEIVTNLPNFLLVTEIGRFFGSDGLVMQEVGRIGSVLGGAGLTYGEWLGVPEGFCGGKTNCWINNWPALTIPFMAPAISIFLLRQHFQSIPSELWDAARMDGAGHFRFLIQIVLPLSRAALFVILLFAFIGTWNSLSWPILVTSGDDWRPIAVGLQSFLDEEGPRAHLQMAGSMITIFPILILYALTQRTFIEGLSQSGLKG